MTAMSVSFVERKPIDKFFDEAMTVGFSAGLIAGVAIAATQKSQDWTPVMLPMRSQPVAGESREATTAAPVYRPRLRLKLLVGGQKVVGTLVEQRDDSIVLAWNSGHTSYPTASVTDVRVSRGKSMWTGVKFGGLIGAGVGLVTAAAQVAGPNDAFDPIDGDCDPNIEACRYESDFAHASKQVAAYTLAGAIAGAVIRRERWVKGELPASSSHGEPARLLFAPSRHGFRIGLHATF
jgi:hypothetical protein